jgi:opacity protein-like surface antigen
MKKHILLLTAILFIVMSAEAQVRLGLRGGLNASSFSETDNATDTNKFSSSMITSFQVGAVLDLPFSENFSLQPGLIFSGKGAKQNNTFMGARSEGKITPMYLEVPVNLLFRADVGGVGIYATAGPYLAFGVGGRKSFKTSSIFGDTSDEGSISYGSDQDDDDLENTDYGFNIGAGIELARSFGLGLNYGVGLKNVLPGNPSDKLYNRVISLNATILLGGQ